MCWRLSDRSPTVGPFATRFSLVLLIVLAGFGCAARTTQPVTCGDALRPNDPPANDTIGPDVQTKTTAMQLLDLTLDFIGLQPDRDTWNAASLESNPPRYYRFLRIQALLKALGHDPDVNAFVDGAFIEKVPLGYYRDFASKLNRSLLQRTGRTAFVDAQMQRFDSSALPWRRDDIVWCFQNFLRFSTNLREVLDHNSGWLEAGGLPAQYMIRYTQSLIIADLQRSYNEINAVLASIVDPRERVIPMNKLVKDFGYPNVDLIDVDAEWW